MPGQLSLTVGQKTNSVDLPGTALEIRTAIENYLIEMSVPIEGLTDDQKAIAFLNHELRRVRKFNRSHKQKEREEASRLAIQQQLDQEVDPI